MYALAVDAQPLRLPLVAQALRGTLDVGGRCAAILPGDPAAFVAKARLAGVELAAFEASGGLALLRQRHDPLLPLFRAGPHGVLGMIERSVGEGCDLLVLEQAEPLLFLGDPALASQACDGLREWAVRTRTTVLVTFTPGARPQREFLSSRAAVEDFAGFGVVREHPGGVLLELGHWFGDGGAHPRANLPLRAVGRGTLCGDVPVDASACHDDAAPPAVVAIRSAVDDPAGVLRNAGWSLVDDASALIDAARGLAAGAVILPFDRATHVRALCHAVASARRAAGPRVSVIVRERGLPLRLAQQIALTRLGAVTVVPAHADDADLAQAVRALAGVSFTRPLPDDVEEAIAAAGSASVPRLSVTRAFRETVAEVLAASEGLELPHALLHVACDPAKAQQLGTFALQRRLRDAALTVDPSGLWVFLYGCPPNRAPRVAARLFGRYHAEVAAGISVDGTVGAIAHRLERMTAAVGLRDAATARRARAPLVEAAPRPA